QAAFAAMCLAIFINALILIFAPRSFCVFAESLSDFDEFEIDFFPPETQSLTQPQFIEANPLANSELPENPTPYESYKDQRAAQEKDAPQENSNLPKNESGEEEAHKIVSGNLQEEVLQKGAESVFETLERPLTNPGEPSMQPQAQNAPQSQSPFEKLEADSEGQIKISENFAPTEKSGDGESLEEETQTQIEEPLPAPKPRPHISYQTAAGPMLANATSANKIGITAVDSRFSEFGAYQQRMVEAIVRQWYLLASMHTLSNEANTMVVIEYFLNAQGEITSIKTVLNTSTLTGKSLCEQAILSTAPYGAWTQEMLASFGSQDQSVKFTFYYK
ncbi:MAG: hypothetical protein IKO42_07265, partial [Opitutales bacterium]|nr:hypothetical protein [Opitutales bacterium]